MIGDHFQALLKTTTDFLAYVGYTLESPKMVGFVKPDIFARRASENRTWQVALVLQPGMDHLLDGLRDLQAMKGILGSEWDYGIVLPPVSEYALIEFLAGEENWHYEIKKQGFMIWLVNPQRGTVISLIGGPRDPRFKDYFAVFPGGISFDAYLARKTASKILEEDL